MTWANCLPRFINHHGIGCLCQAEISTASCITSDMLDIGQESFIADDVSLGAARIERGNHHCTSWATVLCFLHADDAFVGCLTLAPTNAEAAERDGRAWIGSPPLKLLQRQQSKTFSLCRTFEPTVWMWMQRGTIEFIG